MKVGLSLGMRFINGSLMAHAATVADGGSTAGDDIYAPVGNTNDDIDAFFVSMAAQVRDLVLESHGAPAPEP